VNRFFLVGVLVLGLLIAPAVIAVGEAQPRYGGTFVTAIPYEEIIGLDPLRITIWNGSSVGVIIQIHEGAVKWNTTTLEIEPALAESWQLSEDARIYTLHVRKGAKFHNGREVVAQDFKYSFERMMDPELGGLSTYLFSGVVGVDEYVAGTADEISGIVVVSASELRVTLKQIDVSFLHNLCEPGAVIVPQEEVDAIGLDAFNRDPVGAGPFKFVSWIGNEITLEAFDGYWGGRPYLDTLKLVWRPEPGAREAAFDAGELDGLAADPTSYARWKEDPVVSQHMIEGPELWTRHIGFNTEWGPFRLKKVRQAFNYAIDKVTMVEWYLHAKAYPATGVFPAVMDAYNPELKGYGYDPEKAKELLAEAGYPDGFTVDIVGDPTSPDWGIPAVVAVMSYLETVGIHVNPIPTEYGAMVEQVVRGDFEGYVDAFGGVVSSLNYINGFHSSNIGTSNWTRYSNPEVDALLDLAGRTTDDDTRIAYLRAAELLIVEDAPIWFDNYNKAVYVYQPWVHGVQPCAVDITYQDYELVWVDDTSPRAGG